MSCLPSTSASRRPPRCAPGRAASSVLILSSTTYQRRLILHFFPGTPTDHSTSRTTYQAKVSAGGFLAPSAPLTGYPSPDDSSRGATSPADGPPVGCVMTCRPRLTLHLPRSSCRPARPVTGPHYDKTPTIKLPAAFSWPPHLPTLIRDVAVYPGPISRAHLFWTRVQTKVYSVTEIKLRKCGILGLLLP